MKRSEILKEKDRVQEQLAKESSSIHDYLMKCHQEAEEIAEEYGMQLKYGGKRKKSDSYGHQKTG